MLRKLAAVASLSLLAACSDDPTSNGGAGSARFTTWGEEFIEQGIPSDPAGEDGFYDGWSVKYAKFLVTYHGIRVADAAGTVIAEQTDALLVDNVLPGRKELVRFDGIEAKAWERVSYQIKPATSATKLVGNTPEADRDFMAQNGYAIYVEGTATRDADGATKSFHWGFKTATQYANCQAEEGGRIVPGIVVTNGSTDTSELTTHGDHLFYDRLQESPNPEVPTRLRFQEKADADANNDGEINLDELYATELDPTLYNPSPFNVTSLGAFMEALSRTVGHYRGEGECTVSAL